MCVLKDTCEEIFQTDLRYENAATLKCLTGSLEVDRSVRRHFYQLKLLKFQYICDGSVQDTISKPMANGWKVV